MTAPESKAALGMVDVLAGERCRDVHGDAYTAPWCHACRGWAAHAAAAVLAAGFGDTATARAEALTQAAKWVIGCEHVTALHWCGICDQWRAALEAEAARIARAARPDIGGAE